MSSGSDRYGATNSCVGNLAALRMAGSATTRTCLVPFSACLPRPMNREHIGLRLVILWIPPRAHARQREHVKLLRIKETTGRFAKGRLVVPGRPT